MAGDEHRIAVALERLVELIEIIYDPQIRRVRELYKEQQTTKPKK